MGHKLGPPQINYSLRASLLVALLLFYCAFETKLLRTSCTTILVTKAQRTRDLQANIINSIEQNRRTLFMSPALSAKNIYTGEHPIKYSAPSSRNRLLDRMIPLICSGGSRKQFREGLNPKVNYIWK